MTIKTKDITKDNYHKFRKVYQLCTDDGVHYFDNIEDIEKEGFKILGMYFRDSSNLEEYHLWKDSTPRIEGLLGGMFGGSASADHMKNIYPTRWHDLENTVVIRFESQMVYNHMST